MFEQRERVEIAVYCDRCRHWYGDEQLLARVDRVPGEGWQVWVARRADRAPFATVVAPTVGAPPGPLLSFGQYIEVGDRHRLVLLPLRGSAAQLACRRCPRRPREARAKLVKLAEQAIAAGRRDAYA